MSRKIQFEFWKPWKLFTQKLFVHKDMLYAYQGLPEQKPNSKQEKTIYGQKLLTFEKYDGKNILCGLKSVGFQDSSTVFPELYLALINTLFNTPILLLMQP